MIRTPPLRPPPAVDAAVTKPLQTMTTNLSRTSSTTSKRKADDDGVVKRKPTTGLKINSGPAPVIRSSSVLGHSTSRPPSALAQHPRTSHTPPTSDAESSSRPMRQAPPSPPVPAIVAARARGESIPPADPVPARAPSRAGSVTRKTSAPVNKGKGKSKLPGLGLPMGVLPEEEAEDRWMAGQRSELDAKERDNQRRAGVSSSMAFQAPVLIAWQNQASRTSTLNFPSSATGSTPSRKRTQGHSTSSSSGLNRAVLDSSLPVPISDTPVIVRNREIRQASQSRRRSSLSSRATPHASVPPDTFYRHVDPDLPDALRLRQVLCWTASRASDKRPAHKSSPIVQDLLKSIQSQAIKRLASGQINTTISPARTSDSNKVLPPHPKNVTNAQAISKLEAYNQACQAEDSAWSELIAAYNSQQAQVVAALASSAEKEPKDIELDDQWQEGMQLVKEVLRTVKEGVGDGADADDEMSDGEQEIVDRIGALEPQVYEAYESTYRMDQFTTKAAVHLENVFGTLASTLRQRTAPQSTLVPRDETGRMLGVGSGSAVNTMDLLRALTGPGSASGTSAAKVNGIPPRALNEALQKVTPVNAAPTPRKPPGTPRASRGGVGRTKKR
ncbi:Mis12-Mtw1 protein family [Rhizoctonia solani]|uniref:Mis12-Mtw1 protein family n=1 Tax=Rhizoctonia solani TaxID=456999 RepID=A0A8H7H7B3_9AGAM|nr:Mis12-Mtw1 protein family [Rhizoctonia solani]